MKFADYVDLDKLGMTLSIICGVHCFLTPLVILSLPIMARYYLLHPGFHLLMAALIIPVGLFAFIIGYRHHHKALVLYLGMPGLFIVSLVPVLVHFFKLDLPEYPLVILGSVLLIVGHWINRKSCSCSAHSH